MKTTNKTFVKIFSIFYILSFLIFNLNTKVFAISPPPNPAADGAVIMDAITGEILYQKNMNTPYPPASTTKTMTALLTLENCSLDDVVTISKKAEQTDGSRIYIYKGEKIKVRDLLYALMLVSANDCAVALAEHIGGSVENFANMMNKRAAELGCKNTHFVNPNGLYDDKHRTSAYDLALIMRELMKHPEYRKIAKTLSYKIQPTNKCEQVRPLWNGNRLINGNEAPYYKYLEAAKTGYTIQSKHSYVASAMKNNQRLIVALIHDSKKHFYNDCKKLFEYGFNNYELVKLYAKGDVLTNYHVPDSNISMPLIASSDFYIVKQKNSTYVPLPNYKEIDLSKSYKTNEYITDATITYKDKKRTLKLLSGCDYCPENNSKNSVSVLASNSTNDTKSHYTNPGKTPFIIAISLIILLIVLIRILQINHIKKRRKK
ncbi:D-alanyl-D-alanine carboxypeptidase DacB precursor [Clostridium tepidiprofundi DSM 19306]|uniref:D-alanyl-D-alanine carboxypeptidase DacB n=1 Tax=Clostridium tepidiprofundi DSM 19306 TaxID=1121338 RepID=A0A151B3L1_9CLOT|nr:D-alanyl-D-alanine carboxypeptidase family protein [Clostridium tepidiprofundi]KYH34501.1 D-alanyl-D-alanine carboxypeptidase DacB precursor [Clostridium tepidiprofundi DSM 19306]